MAPKPQMRNPLQRVPKAALALSLALTLCLVGLPAGSKTAWGATTGMTSQQILVIYGKGNIVNTWNENILTVDGEWAYCVQVDKHFESGVNVSACDPVAKGIWSQELCTKLALIDEFVWSGEFMSTGTLGKPRHKVTNDADKYAVAQCYLWKTLDDAGFSDYDWFSVNVDGQGLTGRDTDKQVSNYVNARKGQYVGHASYYDCKGSQNVACDFRLEPATGSVALEKTSSNPETSANNSCYSNEGAVYGIYSDKDCTKESARMTTGSDGKAVADNVPVGVKYVREITAPAGMALDRTVHRVAVSAGKTTEVEGSPVTDVPKSCPVELLAAKHDAQLPSGSGACQGASTLANAQFTVEFYAGRFDNAQTARSSGTLRRTWTFETDAQGMVIMDDDHFVSGDPLYHDSKGRPCLPLGTVVIRESKPPVGYLANDDDFCIQIRDDGGTEETVRTYRPAQVPEQVRRGDLELVKVGGAERRHLAGVPFRITSQTTGESHVIATDANGYASTAASWNPHTRDTNANDRIEWEPAKETSSDTATAEERSPSSTEGESGDTSARSGKAASKKTATAADETLEDAGAKEGEVPNGPGEGGIPESARAASDETDHRMADTGMEGAESGNDPSESIEGNVQGRKAETAGNGPYNAEAGIWFGYDGTQSCTIEPDDNLGALPFDTYSIEELPCPSNEGLQLVKASVIITKDKTVVDLGTVEDPRAWLRTSASDAADGDCTIPYDEGARIVDRVHYANLLPGREYTVRGTVAKASDAALATDAEGNPVSAECTFTPSEAYGYVDLAFDVSTEGLAGESLVVQETLFQDGRAVARHDALDDPDQTVAVAKPAISTSASNGDGESRTIEVSSQAHVVDRVSYTGLVPGREYTITGTLMDKKTEEPIQSDGKPATARTIFTPENPEGNVEVHFEFDSSELEDGRQIVVFEVVSLNGKELISHADPENEAQTVQISQPKAPEPDMESENEPEEEPAQAAQGYDKAGNWIDRHRGAFALVAAAGCISAAYGLARPRLDRSQQRPR